MVITTSVYSDLQTPGFPPIINAVQGEQYSRRIKLALYSAGVAWTVPAGVYVAMRYKKPDGTRGYYDTMPDGTQAWSAEENVVNIYVAPQMLTVAGVVLAQVEIIQNDSILATFPLRLRVAENLAAPLQTSEDYVNWLQWMEDQLAQRWADAVESGELTGPQGPQGEKGDTGDPAVLESSVVEYQASDSGTITPSGAWSTSVPVVPQGKYLWTRTTTTYNTGSPVVSYSISRMGIDGSGSVSSVCGVSPGSDGDVTLTAANVGAMPTTGGDFTGPVSMNGQTLSGLNSPTADDDAATKGYAAGLRVQNLLDNSDFVVNQRGQTSYENNVYAFDRWVVFQGKVEAEDGYVRLYQNALFLQRISSLPNGRYSLAIKVADGTIYCGSVESDESETAKSAVANESMNIYIQKIYDNNYQFVISATQQLDVVWAVLYPGVYTAETLPPYVPKGYAVELVECMRYYFRSWNGAISTSAFLAAYSPISEHTVSVNFPFPMRINPTVTLYDPTNGDAGYISEWSTGKKVAASAVNMNNKHFIIRGEIESGKSYVFDYEASADL